MPPKIETPNFWKGRDGHSVKAIVIHVTGGTFESAKQWIENIQSAVSYHILVKEDGQFHQIVAEQDTAWANGITVNPTWKGIIPRENPNKYTFPIAYAGQGNIGPTRNQISTLALLIAHYTQKFKIGIDEKTVIPHNQIRQDKNCPGTKCNMEALRWMAAQAA